MNPENPPLKQIHPDLYEALVESDKAADNAEEAEKAYHEKMRIALKMTRDRLGVTAKVFGVLAGIKEAQVYACEAGRRRWSKKALVRLKENFQMF